VTGRELVFSHPDVVRLARDSFVPYAGDQWYLHRQKDAPGQYFWKVAQQGHYKDQPEDASRQGIYVATPDGRLLGSDRFSPSPERMVGLLRRSLTQAKQTPETTTVADEAPATDARYRREPPSGGLVLDVFTRIPRSDAAGEKWTPNHATGRDHMWLTHSEWRALLPASWKKGVRVAVPRAVAERLIRFHLVDNVRGEPPVWAPGEIKQSELTLTVADPTAGRLLLEGVTRLETKGSTRGYDARLQGYVEYDRAGDRIKRCDLLTWGEAWGSGPYTPGAPSGRFPLVIAFSLAGNAPADRVPPQASRDLTDYLGAGR